MRHKSLLILVAFALALTACAAPTPTPAPKPEPTKAVAAPTAVPPTPVPPTAAPQKVKIRLTTWAGADESKELQAVIDKVNAASSTFEIVHEPVPADYYTKLQTSIAGGTAADLMWLSHEEIIGYASRGALLDITEFLKADKTNPAAKLDDYFEPVLASCQYQGKYYGLPWIAQPVVMFYNPELFAKAGIKEPDETWDWATFKDVAKRLTIPGQQWGTSFNGWPPPHMWVWQAGGEVISPDLKTCPVDSPEAIQGLQFYADIIYNPEYAVPEEVIKEQGFGEMAKAGKVAMFFGGASDDLDYAYTKDPKNAKLKVALVPKGPAGRATFAWSAATSIWSGTKNKQAAYEALVALTEGIHHWKIVAPRKSLANVETIVASVPGKKDSAATILKALPDMRPFRVIPKYGDWNDVFWNQFMDPLFHKKGTAADLAKAVRPKLEATLPK